MRAPFSFAPFRSRSAALSLLRAVCLPDPVAQSLLARCPDGAGRAVKRDDLVWAMECVLSRAFNGRFGGGQNVSSTTFLASSLNRAATIRASSSRMFAGGVGGSWPV